MAGADPSYQFLACQYLGEQLQALMHELVGVRRHEEIEPVHKARVASRRLRAALRMFAECFDAKKLSRWQKQIKRLTRELGEARDRDVQIEFVEGFLAALNERDRRVRPGIERLLLRWRQSREALQPEIVGMLDKLESAGTLAQMYGEIEQRLFILRSRDVYAGSPYVYRVTADHIHERLDGLLACAHSLEDPKDIHGHHQMRIAAKKLRYTLEVCRGAYEAQLEAFIEAAKRVQSLLGDVHDCDVWMEDIEVFLEQERMATLQYFGNDRFFGRLKPGLLALRDERGTHRKHVFGEMLKYWESLDAKHPWDSLDRTLESRLEALGQAAHEPQERVSDAGTARIQEDHSAE